MNSVRTIAVAAAIAIFLSLSSVSTAAQSASCSKTSASAWFGEDSIVNRVFSLFAKAPSAACGATTTAAPAGIVAWWPGDGSANDIAGLSNGVLQNGAGFAVGKVGQSFAFDGTDDFIGLGDPVNLKFTNSDFTVEGWFLTPDVPNNPGTQCGARYPIFGYDNGYSVEIFGDGRLRFRKSTGPSTGAAVGTVNPLTVGTMHHFAAVHTTTEMRLYVDGVLDNTTAITDGSVFYVNGDFPEIGHFTCGFSGVFDFYFKGRIDETSVYDRALSTFEVESIFNSGVAGKLKERATVDSASLISIWRGEGDAGDTRGVSNGTLQNGATFTTGNIGQAFSFDGVNDFVEIPDAPALNPSQLTVDAWVFPTSDSSGGGLDALSLILAKESVTTNQYEIGRRNNTVCGSGGGIPTGNFVFYIEGLTGLPDDCSAWVDGNGNLPLNLWSHVAMTFDGANVRAYVNGVLTRTIPVTGTITTTPGTIQLGGRARGSTAFLQGRIDEPGVYNRALTAAEIRANYDAGNALSTVVGDARVTFPNVSTAGITQQIPLDPSTLPALPQGSAATGLSYDIATTATFSGAPQVCFHLPSFTTATAFADLYIFHLENGVWTNRSGTSDFASRTLCSSGLTSLSTFAIVSGIAAPCVPNQKTWDGGGASNNWSEAANWTCDAVPLTSDNVIFDGASSKNATIDVNIAVRSIQLNAGYNGIVSQGASNIEMTAFQGGSLTVNAGTFNAGGGLIALDLNSFLTINGGTFNGSTGTIRIRSSALTVNGGTFNAPTGLMSFEGSTNAVSLELNGGTFNANGGSVTFREAFSSCCGGIQIAGASAGTADFFNVEFNNTNGTTNIGGGDTLRVLGTLRLTNGNIDKLGNNNPVTVQAEGDVIIDQGFGNGSGSSGSATIRFAGNQPNRVVTIPSGMTDALLPFEVDSATTTIRTTGSGFIGLSRLDLRAGAIETGSADFRLLVSNDHQISGGSFVCGAGTVTIGSGTLTQSGGTVNCAAATALNLDFLVLNLNGGTFTAPATTLNFSGGNFNRNGGTFSHSNGTIRFDGYSGPFGSRSGVDLNFDGASAGTQIFNNVEFNNRFGLNSGISNGDTLVAAGELRLVDGIIAGGTIEARGNVTVAATFDPAPSGNDSLLRFGGGAAQTFTNLGAANPAGLWTIDKTAGTTVTAASDLLLAANQPLAITSGNLLLADGSDLTAGAISIGANGVLKNESSTTITLGGNLVNNGVVDLQGGGAGCPENDTILIRSTSGQRSWTGGGRYRLVDVDVQNMGGAGTKNVFSGTNSGGNNASWVFDANCPAALSVTPSTTSVQTGATQQFTAGGGFAPYSFSLATNNSGGSITSGGLYTAGASIGRTDTVRVTDFFGQTATASASTVGPAVRLRFQTLLGNTVAGDLFTVAVAVVDANGNVVTNAADPVTMTLTNNIAGATLSGTLTQTPVNGIATFSDLSIDRFQNGYVLQADSGTLLTGRSNTFSIVAGPATQLLFTFQPNRTNSGAIIQPAVSVIAADRLGNRANPAPTNVTIAIGANPGGGTLAGTLTKPTVNGLVNFGDLSIDRPGIGYTLVVSAPSLSSATSASFNIDDPFNVTTTGSSGPTSLRKAIENANATPGTAPITITFNIPENQRSAPGGRFIIEPLTPLPVATRSVIIDGTSQPGYAGTPQIELRGLSNADGLTLAAADSAVKGLALNGWSDAIVATKPRFTIKGNVIGSEGLSGQNKNAYGVFVRSTTGSIEDNVISGNLAAGIDIIESGPFTPGAEITIRRNLIGVKTDGVTANGNDTGIVIVNSARVNTFVNIGGELADQNVIAFNRRGGIVHASPSITARVRRNRIYANSTFLGASGLPIKLSRTNNAVPINDPLDADSGPNGLQNSPLITSVVSENGQTTIHGTLNSTPNTTFGIDLFDTGGCINGIGNAENYLDSVVNVTTDAGGIASFTKVVNQPIQIGRQITSTAWAEDGIQATSEVSACSLSNAGGSVVTGANFAISGKVVDVANAPIAGVRVSIQNSTISTVTAADGTYRFNSLPNGFNYTIAPAVANYVFAPLSRTVSNLQSNIVNQNFTGTRISNITGQVVSRINGTSFALANATVTVGGIGSVTTDVNGRYSVNNLLPATYTVNAAKPQFIFTPATVTVGVNGDRVLNFEAEAFNVSLLRGRIMSGAIGVPVMNADGGGAMNLFYGAFVTTPQNGRFSPDGTRMVFQRNTNAGQTFVGRIASALADGTSERRATTTSDTRISEDEPSLSPDNSRIVFVRNRRVIANDSAICVIAPDGTSFGVVHSVASPGAVYGLHNPVFSPDGNAIVFVNRNTLNQSHIYRINRDGTNLVQLTSGNYDSYPQWSPDGTKILFVRREPNGTQGRIFTINSNNGGNLTEIPTPLINKSEAATFSPDGTVIFFREFGEFKVMLTDGSLPQTVTTTASSGGLSWAPDLESATPAGSNVAANFAGVSVGFGTVTSGGTTTVTPIPPNSAGAIPQGFAISNQAGNLTSQAFEISTTASVTAPIDVCVTLVGTIGLADFNRYRILHNESGVLVDRTFSRDFATKKVCARTTSLSPFVVAEEIDANLATIGGIAVDAAGNPLAGVSLTLTGAADKATETDSNGAFRFVNLTPGANYNVSPKLSGVLFDAYNQNFVNLTGEETVVFTGTAQNFAISGTVTDGAGAPLPGATIVLGGGRVAETTTDANGAYSFVNLPADDSFTVSVAKSGTTFTDDTQLVEPLAGDATNVDFQSALVPTAATATLGGRVSTANGAGIRNAVVTLTDSNGRTRSVHTGTFGVYSFGGLPAGDNYVVTVAARRFAFANPTRVVNLADSVSDADFTATER